MRHTSLAVVALLALAAVLPAACQPSSGGPAAAAPASTNPPTGTAAGRQPAGASRADAAPGVWKSLLDGGALAAWRGYKSADVPPGWKLSSGVLAKERPVADIVTRDTYGDFELELDWRIGDAGNAGIFYRGTEEYERIYWTAPEYQLLDDIKGADNKTRLTCAGAAYGLYPSPPGHLKPVGEWNTTRIVARGAHVEHWLNGVKLLEYELWSPDWEAKVKASKFSVWPKYGRERTGHIALQGDHQGSLAFRNMRIREYAR